MQEEIKNGINAESKEKRKLNDAELAQVTGGKLETPTVLTAPTAPWETCDRNCGACNVSNCPKRDYCCNVVR